MTRQQIGQIEHSVDSNGRTTRSTRSTGTTTPTENESTHITSASRSTRRSTRKPQTQPTKPKRNNRKIMNMVLLAIILIGIGTLGYGGFMYYDIQSKAEASTQEVTDLLNNRVKIEPTDNDPFGILATLEEKAKFMNSGFGHGDGIGMLYIPKLKGELPIVEGVNPDDLMKGVGHYQGTSLPTDNGLIVLSGHRDTVFRGMADLELGDTMTVSLPYGDFEYKVVEMYITSADDRSVIVPDEYDDEHLIVTTCYPFNFIGNAPDRYIVNAEPMFDAGLFKEKQAEYKMYLNQNQD